MLLVAVLAIWGIIGFKIMVTLNPEVPKVAKQDGTELFSPKVKTVMQSFTIQSSERDPFLGTLTIKKKLEEKPKAVSKKQAVVWVPIRYHGAISKLDNKDKVCVVSINGQQHLMKIGQDLNGVKLLKASDIEILVSYKGEKKNIEKL